MAGKKRGRDEDEVMSFRIPFLIGVLSGIYILAIFCTNWKTEEFEGGLEKRKGKGGKRRKQRKQTLKCLYEA